MIDLGFSLSFIFFSISLGNNSVVILYLYIIIFNEVDILVEQDGKVKIFMEFIILRKRGFFWNYEDVFVKNFSIKSVEQLIIFLKYVVFVFKQLSLEVIYLEYYFSEVVL